MSKIEYDVINAKQCRGCEYRGDECNRCDVMIAHKKAEEIAENIIGVVSFPISLGRFLASEFIEAIIFSRMDDGR
jgi:hypothetical protein